MFKDLESKKALKEAIIWIRDLAIVLAIVWLFITFVGQLTNVSGQSMYPTLNDNDWILIEKVTMRVSGFDRYDVVVFPYANNPKINYIKRVIGLPGDTVDIKDGKILINGEVLQEPVAYEPITGEENFTTQFPAVVPEAAYFVMGDNRNNSSDSRYSDVGFIHKKDIVGKGFLRIFPFTQIGFVD